MASFEKSSDEQRRKILEGFTMCVVITHPLPPFPSPTAHSFTGPTPVHPTTLSLIIIAQP